MTPWAQRPIEEANLLNPAFCCVALTSASIGYMDIDKEGIPFALTFMVLPIVLHKTTRESLPRDTRTSLASWIQANSGAKVQFAKRVVALAPYTKEAILFGCLHDWFLLGSEGRLQSALNESSNDRFISQLKNEAKECVKRSRFLGKWFALAGTAKMVMSLWEIKP